MAEMALDEPSICGRRKMKKNRKDFIIFANFKNYIFNEPYNIFLSYPFFSLYIYIF